MRIYLQSFETTHKRVDSKYIGEEYIYIYIYRTKVQQTKWDFGYKPLGLFIIPSLEAKFKN